MTHRHARSSYIVAREDGAYLARHANGIYHWAWTRDEARLFRWRGSAEKRAERHGGAVVVVGGAIFREG